MCCPDAPRHDSRPSRETPPPAVGSRPRTPARLRRRNLFLTRGGFLNADGRRLCRLAARPGGSRTQLAAEYRRLGYDDFSIQLVFLEADDRRRAIQRSNRRRARRNRPPAQAERPEEMMPRHCPDTPDQPTVIETIPPSAPHALSLTDPGHDASAEDTMNTFDGNWSGFSPRSLRLYACACCRRVWDRLALDGRLAVEAAERFADGLIDLEELDEAWGAAKRLEALRRPDSPYTERVHRVAAPIFTLEDAGAVTQDLRPWRGDRLDNDEADAAHAHLFRDVFGGPARPVMLDPAWRVPEVLSLARSVYWQRCSARMPELAAALEAAGCRDVALLGHCRSGQDHVRGCWALDAVLGLH
jgi:hypothetical protein